MKDSKFEIGDEVKVLLRESDGFYPCLDMTETQSTNGSYLLGKVDKVPFDGRFTVKFPDYYWTFIYDASGLKGFPELVSEGRVGLLSSGACECGAVKTYRTANCEHSDWCPCYVS